MGRGVGLTICLIVVCAAQVYGYLWQSPLSGDSRRYLDQARTSLAEGAEHWTFAAVPHTSLPPGYPLFLRALLSIRDSTHFIQVCQVLLTCGTCALLWLALRSHGAISAMIGFLALGLNPWLGRLSTLVYSESLATFLAAALLLVVVTAREHVGDRVRTCLGAGFVSGALILTSPALLPFTLAMGVAVIALERWIIRTLLYSAGLLVLVGPWQVHCFRANGHVEPFLLTPSGVEHSGIIQWAQTWMTRPSQLGVFWQGDPLREIEDVPLAPGERTALADASRAKPGPIAEYVVGSDYDLAFTKAAAATRKREPFRVFVTLPLIRSYRLWTEPWPRRPLPRRLFEIVSGGGPAEVPSREGRELDAPVISGVPREGRASLADIVSAAGIVLYSLMFLSGIWWGVRSREPVALATLLGIAVYTAISAWSAMGEFRRSIPFYPALIYLHARWLSDIGKRPWK